MIAAFPLKRAASDSIRRRC